MKRIVFGAALLIAAVGCSKSEITEDVQMNEELVELEMNISVDGNATKASGADFGVNTNDNTLNTMDLFVFRTKEGSKDYGALEYYRRFSSDECSGSFDFSLQLTTGPKRIISIGNSHRDSWPNITNLTSLEKEVASLQGEKLKNFTMLGVVNTDVTKSTSISYSISRLVSRVVVSSIKTKFEGTPYEGYSLEDVKIYLTNVQGKKYIATNGGQNLQVLNSGKAVDADINACSIKGMLYEDTGADITDSGHATKHYFYCYSNNLEQESGGNMYTRLVLEGKINGITYFYPIVLKQLQNNCSYSYEITILRPGSLDPSEDITNSQVNTVCSVSNWQEQPLYKVEF